MTSKNIIIYKCDFCKKKLQVKHAMDKHEKFCHHNPVNYRPCNECKFLESCRGEDEERHYVAGGEFETMHIQHPNFYRCTKFDKKVYSITAERKNLLEKHPETFEDQEPMPKHCEGFEKYTL